jgi:shikimate dehydrogenase
VNSRTVRVGLLGEGIGTSLTPAMHVREGRRMGLNYEYEVFDVPAGTYDTEGLRGLLDGLRFAGLAGLNVTHPYKQAVIPLLDELDEDAARIGAVNLIRFVEGRSIGSNTDWTGFAFGLARKLEHAPRRAVLQFGAGGAGAATAYALLRLGAEHVTIHDLDPQRSASLAARYQSAFPRQHVSSTDGSVDHLWQSFDGVVHATPMGMAKHPGSAFDPRDLRADAWVAEVVYLPIETELVLSARAAGRMVLDGTLMAAGQAIDSLRLITGMEPDADRVLADLADLVGGAVAATAGS